MHVPGLLQRVRLAGIDDVYLVTRVDLLERMADVLPLVYGKPPVQNVPFHSIEAIPGYLAPKLQPD